MPDINSLPDEEGGLYPSTTGFYIPTQDPVSDTTQKMTIQRLLRFAAVDPQLVYQYNEIPFNQQGSIVYNAQQQSVTFNIPAAKDGEIGISGKSILSGNGVPSNSIGRDEEFYIDLQTYDIYYKTAGVWGDAFSLVGPTSPLSFGDKTPAQLSTLRTELGFTDAVSVSFQTFAEFLSWANTQDYAVGTLATVNDCTYIFDDTSNVFFDAELLGWRPVSEYVASPQHWAPNTNPGVTDMHAAAQACATYLSQGPITSQFAYQAAHKNSGSYLMDLKGEIVAVSKPIVFGGIDVDLDGTFAGPGSGMVSDLVLDHGRLKATDDFDDTPLATFNPGTGPVTTVPAALVVAGTYDQYDRETTLKGTAFVYHFKLGSGLELDANFVTNGFYIENTYGTVVEASHIFNLKRDGFGILTSLSSKIQPANLHGTYNPRGITTINTELKINDVFISGVTRVEGTQFSSLPFTDEQDQNATGLSIRTADAFIRGGIFTRLNTSIFFDGFFNVQGSVLHPWAEKIVYGIDCHHLMMSNQYMDFTDLVLYSFDHNINNLNLLAGGSNLRLVATQPNEVGEGLVITGLFANQASAIQYEVDVTLNAGASWADEDDREINLAGVYSEGDTIPKIKVPGVIRDAPDGIHLGRNSMVKISKTPNSGNSPVLEIDDGQITSRRHLLGNAVGRELYGLVVSSDPNVIELDTTNSVPFILQGYKVRFFVTSTNTGAVTLSVDGSVAKNLRTMDNKSLAPGYLVVGQHLEAVYDGTRWRINRAEETLNVGVGTITRYASGRVSMSGTLQLSYSSPANLFGTYGFGSAGLIANPVGTAVLIASTIGAGEPDRGNLEVYRASVSPTFISFAAYRSDAIDFETGDTADVDFTIEGRWFA